MSIRGMIFDADGPLYYRGNASQAAERVLFSKYGVNDVNALKALYDELKNKAYIREIAVLEMFSMIFHSLKVKIDQQQLINFIREFDKLHGQVSATEGSEEMLKQLKDRDIHVCVLTDSFYPENEKWNWFKSINLDKNIDSIVTSYDIRMLKDSAGAYHQCLKKMNLPKDEVAFVGHKQYEMDGAMKAGITSIALLPISPPDIKADYKLSSISDISSWVTRQQ